MRSELKHISTRPTHAGGVVYKMENGTAYYLLVRPKNGRNEWVLPKGHIQDGEDEGDAALREVREETGVIARLICRLETVEFKTESEIVRVIFFLLEFASQADPTEIRERRWFRPREALERLTHPQSKQVLQKAEEKRV
jgi:ADP-ribose pyrophosphatase YjhB (NUDIX family)